MRENSRDVSMKPKARSTLFGGGTSASASALARLTASISAARVGSGSWAAAWPLV
jgi:hypothetical protein